MLTAKELLISNYETLTTCTVTLNTDEANAIAKWIQNWKKTYK